MNLEQLIIELLESKVNLIIPGFGSLIKSGPEGAQTLIFNQYLTYNDKGLSGALAEKMNITEPEALAKIGVEVGRIKEIISSEGSYTIDNLGAFKASGSTILFKSTQSIAAPIAKIPEPIETPEDQLPEKEYEKLVATQQDEVEEIAIDTFEEAQAEAVADTIIEENIQSPDSPEIIEETQDIPKVEDEISTKKVDELAALKVSTVITTQKEVTEANEVETGKGEVVAKVIEKSADDNKKEVDEVIVPEAKDVVTSIQDVPVEKKKKRKGFLWIGLLCLFSGLALLTFLKWDAISDLMGIDGQTADGFEEEIIEEIQEIENFKDKFGSLGGDDTEEYIAPAVEIEEHIIDSILDEEIQEPEIIEVVKEEIAEEPAKVIIAPTGKLYHVIGGSFGELSNADSFVGQLKDKGYDAVNLGKRGKLYSVSYGGSNSKEDAKLLLKKVKESEEDAGSCWILYF